MLEERLNRLYGARRGANALERITGLIDRWRGPLRDALGIETPSLSERNVVLIAYGDHLRRPGEAPLATLGNWCRAHVKDLVSTVHVLPFHPSTSYEGYAITDYRAVDPSLGSWSDLEAMRRDFALMTDLVLNHCSASHPWFRQFLAGAEPGRDYFVTGDPHAPWLEGVRRARNHSLLTPVETATGVRNLWTTYSPDLVDLNWREPGVCVELLEVMFDSIVRGARLLRLDAFAYTWKEPGTSCVGLPQTHELLRLFQEVLERAGASRVALLPSITNVTQAENFAYFGGGAPEREADLIYNLPLSALVLHALYSGDAGVLSQWLGDLPAAPAGRCYLNLLSNHDGIGLPGQLPDDALRRLLDEATARGALLSSRRPIANGRDAPWEINATWVRACAGGGPAEHVQRVLATHAVLLALRGVPALYLPVLLGGGDDHERVRATGDNRAINRGRFDLALWERACARAGSLEAPLLAGMQRLLRARRSSRAFHPEGAQRVLVSGHPAVIAIARTAPETGETVRCLTSFAPHPVRLPAAGDRPGDWRDLLGGGRGRWSDALELAPYQTRWLGEAA